MSTDGPGFWKRPAVVGAILAAGFVSAAWTVSRLWPERQPPAMSPEQFKETFQAADQADRENWDRMWREAGKKPPPPR